MSRALPISFVSCLLPRLVCVKVNDIGVNCIRLCLSHKTCKIEGLVNIPFHLAPLSLPLLLPLLRSNTKFKLKVITFQSSCLRDKRRKRAMDTVFFRYQKHDISRYATSPATRFDSWDFSGLKYSVSILYCILCILGSG